MADTSEVDAAVITLLQNDATLAALAPNGVHWDEAPQGATRFVIVSLVSHHDDPQFGGRADEDATYLVKYVEKGTSGANAKAAAKRIDELMESGAIAPIGYGLMVGQRIERIRVTEVDDVDRSIRWQHRGGHYQVMVAPAEDATTTTGWIQPGWFQQP